VAYHVVRPPRENEKGQRQPMTDPLPPREASPPSLNHSPSLPFHPDKIPLELKVGGLWGGFERQEAHMYITNDRKVLRFETGAGGSAGPRMPRISEDEEGPCSASVLVNTIDSFDLMVDRLAGGFPAVRLTMELSGPVLFEGGWPMGRRGGDPRLVMVWFCLGSPILNETIHLFRQHTVLGLPPWVENIPCAVYSPKTRCAPAFFQSPPNCSKAL